MKPHFFFSYAGNKRQEVEHIYKNINFKHVDTIVEPFCGSCALSYFIWTQNRNKNYKYILNDIDSNLIQFLKLVKNDDYKDLENDINKKREEIASLENDKVKAKQIYKEYIKRKGLNSYVFARKYYAINVGMFPLNDFKRFNNKLELSSVPFFEFLKTADIEIYNEEANKMIDRYDNDSSFIFLDPPYIASCNNFYSIDTGENINNIYEMLTTKGLKNFECKMLICHENNWIFKLIFKEYIVNETEYRKHYASRKQTTHIVIKNYEL